MNDEWLPYARAVELLHVSKGQVGWYGATGQLDVRRHGRHWQVSRSSLDRLVRERARWITLVEAGQMIGCSSKTAQSLARRGLIRQRRTAGTRLPSVSRASVEAYLRGPGRPTRKPPA